MLVLGVETSCDDTAAAVSARRADDSRQCRLLARSGARPYGGVVPELASRQHIKNVMPIVDGALQNAGATLKDLDGMAVTYGPGLVGSLLVGLSMVKGSRFARAFPTSASIISKRISWRFISSMTCRFLTSLCWLRADTRCFIASTTSATIDHLGGTRDDAAGEAYDKVAKMMGLGYPGGRAIDQSGAKAAIRTRFVFRAREDQKQPLRIQF